MDSADRRRLPAARRYRSRAGLPGRPVRAGARSRGQQRHAQPARAATVPRTPQTMSTWSMSTSASSSRPRPGWTGCGQAAGRPVSAGRAGHAADALGRPARGQGRGAARHAAARRLRGRESGTCILRLRGRLDDRSRAAEIDALDARGQVGPDELVERRVVALAVHAMQQAGQLPLACDAWQRDPSPFKINPHPLTPGPNS